MKKNNNIMDIKTWKEFNINDLFEIKGVSSISVKDLNKKYGSGDYPYVTRTEKNNGITGFYDHKTAPSNVLTIETTLSGLCFYHNYEFSTGDHIAILIPKNFELNKYIALFIKTIWRKNAYKYTYGRPAIIKNIKKTNLLLPANTNGKPDFGYMESYIKELESNVNFKNITTINKPTDQLINMKNWKEFDVTDLFDISGTKTTPLYDLETMYGSGDYPYITTRATNNGVAGYYDYKTEQGNVLVVDSAVTGYVSYQENDFTASDHVELLKPKFNLNKYIALFIKTIFMKGAYKYAYGRKFNQNRIKATKLLLPSKKDGTPDFEFMENYIKSLPYGDKI